MEGMRRAGFPDFWNRISRFLESKFWLSYKPLTELGEDLIYKTLFGLNLKNICFPSRTLCTSCLFFFICPLC